MNQRGTVLQTFDDTALVAVPRPSACGEHCASCVGGCQKHGHQAHVKNTAGAKSGDIVRISADDGAVLRAALWLYGLPLIFFFMGYLLTYLLSEHTTFAIFTAFLAMVCSLGILKISDRKAAPKIEITEILMTDTEKRNQNHGI